MAKQAEQKTTKNLRVLHTQLDGWPKGAIVSPDDLPHPAHPAANEQDRQAARDAQVKRLVSIGAVEEVTEGDTTPMPEGPHKTQQEQTEGAGENQRWGTGKHPLSFFEGKDDDAILKYDGVGPASLKEIRDAQAAQKK